MGASLKEFNHVDLLFPSKYLKAADLRGKSVAVVIESIEPRSELQMRGGKKEKKPVIYLKGKDKAWVLNKTNAQLIAKVHGPEVSAWIGKTVCIRGALVQFGKEEVEAVRVDVKASLKYASVAVAEADAEPAHNPDTGEVTEGDYLAESQAKAEQEFVGYPGTEE